MKQFLHNPQVPDSGIFLLMKILLLLITAFSVIMQRGIPGIPFRVGPGDLLIACTAVWVGWEWFRKKAECSIPPVPILLFAGAVLLSGAVAVVFGESGFSLVKEEIQFIGILIFGWVAAERILKENYDFHTWFRFIAVLVGIEAVAVSIHLALSPDRFNPGLLTDSRNSYTMMLMFALPLLCRTVADIPKPSLRITGLVLLGLAGATVLSLGAFIAGISGCLFLLISSADRKKLALTLMFFIAGFLLTLIPGERRHILAASVSPKVNENYLFADRNEEYLLLKQSYFNTFPEWFRSGNAMRYRRWLFAVKASAVSPVNTALGYGPGSYSDALRPVAGFHGRPSIDTDETIMFNIGVNEPDTYSGYAVVLVETGIVGLLAFCLYLIAPLALYIRRKNHSPEVCAAAASLCCLILMNVFHSHMKSGMFFFTAVCMYAVYTGVSAPDKKEETETYE